MNNQRNDSDGSPLFLSPRAHDHLQQYPFDDLLSLTYSMVYLANKILPWDGIPKHEMAAIKREFQRIMVSFQLKKFGNSACDSNKFIHF